MPARRACLSYSTGLLHAVREFLQCCMLRAPERWRRAGAAPRASPGTTRIHVHCFACACALRVVTAASCFL
eukprot:2725328-Pleurochrysis_carterae.AAC.1